MNVLITGGAGYIGSHCNQYLHRQGVRTVVLDRLRSGHRQAAAWGEFAEGDFGDSARVAALLRRYRIDAVLHFAASADVADSVREPRLYYDNNVAKLLRLLDCMVDCQVKKMVFSSSAAIFGEPIQVPIEEDHPKNPINPYGETKLIGERILRDYDRAYGLTSVCLRYFNAAGADPGLEIGESHEPEHHLLPLLFQTGLGRRERLLIYGSDYATKDGTCVRDYVHVTDLAAAHYLGLEFLNREIRSEAFNLGNHQGFTVQELVELGQEIMGRKIPYAYAPRRAGDPAVLIAANEKAREILGWKPEYSDLRTIVSTAWNWEKNRRF